MKQELKGHILSLTRTDTLNKTFDYSVEVLFQGSRLDSSRIPVSEEVFEALHSVSQKDFEPSLTFTLEF